MPFSPRQNPTSTARFQHPRATPARAFRSGSFRRRSFGRQAPRRRGQAILEAAFILPILLLFMLGIVQFGLVYNARLAMQHACRAGARWASVYGRVRPDAGGNADDKIRYQIQRAAQNMGLGLKATDITIGPPTYNTISSVTNRPLYSTLLISISYDMNKRRIVPGSFYLPVGKGATVTLPVFSGPYVVYTTVMLEGADVP